MKKSKIDMKKELIREKLKDLEDIKKGAKVDMRSKKKPRHKK